MKWGFGGIYGPVVLGGGGGGGWGVGAKESLLGRIRRRFREVGYSLGARLEDSYCRSRLDRFLVSTSWEELALNVIQVPLPRLISDHSPILLDCTRGRRTRSLFRFENMWLRVEDLKDRMAGKLAWEEVMQTSNEQGTLVLLENLNPEYTSGEVEDIIWHACRENSTAKMVQRTAFSSPYSGRALVAFRTKEAAERVSKKLDDGCLMVSNKRPLVASFVTLPELEGNSPFAGHLCVDKLRLQALREMKEAVSTSHCSQPNTIEHEMGIEWRLLQSRSDSWWNRLYKISVFLEMTSFGLLWDREGSEILAFNATTKGKLVRFSPPPATGNQTLFHTKSAFLVMVFPADQK
ncbi:hypothetical protein FXO37_25289 [Capsicum annuum]|nr:hypothetical protein FXO37_25289 [Capsicum annuum]